MTKRLIPGVLVAVYLAATLTARADDKPQPIALEKRVASLPAPTKALGFDITVEVQALGNVIGEARFQAEPGILPGTKTTGWQIRETLTVGQGEDGIHRLLEAWLRPDLEPVQGRIVEGRGDDPLVHAFRRVEGRFEVVVTGDGREGRTKRAERPGHALLGTSSYILLARHVGGKRAAFVGRSFDPTWDLLVAGRPFHDTRITAGPRAYRGRPAWRLQMRCPAENEQLTIVLDASTKALLYAHIQPPSSPAFDLRPKRKAQAADAAILDGAAKTPRAAAMRTALAFLTGDLDLFTATVHWKRLQENGKAYVRGKPSPERFKAAIQKQFRTNRPPAIPADAARKRILAAQDAFLVEMKGKAGAVVTLPPTIAPMRLTVEQIEGTWFLVKLPHQ